MVLIMGVLSWLAQPDVFLTERNIFNIFRQTAIYALLALGEFIVIVTAGIDLSVGSVLALAMMCAAVLADGRRAPGRSSCSRRSLVGLAVGHRQRPRPHAAAPAAPLHHDPGHDVHRPRRHQPHLRRAAHHGHAAGGDAGSARATSPSWACSVPVSLVVVVITFVIAWLFLQHLRTGRHIYAIGGNPQAARVSGINVDRMLVIVYALCGFLAGFAGLLLAGRTNSGFPNAGNGDELDAISAVIIGGASFFGGRGTVLGVFAGVLVIGMLRNLLNLSNVQVFWQQVLIGVVIIAVVAFDVFRRRICRVRADASRVGQAGRHRRATDGR